MYTVTYYKIGTRWYLDFPEYIARGGDPDDLERFGAFHDFLELAAAGDTTVTFHMDMEPFANADCLELIGSSGGKTGGHYRLNRFEGTPVELELWFNTVIYTGLTTLPQRIYFRKIKPSST